MANAPQTADLNHAGLSRDFEPGGGAPPVRPLARGRARDCLGPRQTGKDPDARTNRLRHRWDRRTQRVPAASTVAYSAATPPSRPRL